MFIQNLPRNITREEIEEAFSTVGPIKVNDRSGGPKIWIYKDRMTGEGNGRATVTYEDEETAQKAISEYHGTYGRVRIRPCSPSSLLLVQINRSIQSIPWYACNSLNVVHRRTMIVVVSAVVAVEATVAAEVVVVGTTTTTFEVAIQAVVVAAAAAVASVVRVSSDKGLSVDISTTYVQGQGDGDRGRGSYRGNRGYSSFGGNQQGGGGGPSY